MWDESTKYPFAAKVTVGMPIQFTDDEVMRMRELTQVCNLLTDRQPQGWKVLLVTHLTELNKILHTALGRSHARS